MTAESEPERERRRQHKKIYKYIKSNKQVTFLFSSEDYEGFGKTAWFLYQTDIIRRGHFLFFPKSTRTQKNSVKNIDVKEKLNSVIYW